MGTDFINNIGENTYTNVLNFSQELFSFFYFQFSNIKMSTKMKINLYYLIQFAYTLLFSRVKYGT